MSRNWPRLGIAALILLELALMGYIWTLSLELRALTGEMIPDMLIGYDWPRIIDMFDAFYEHEAFPLYRRIQIVDAFHPLVYGTLLFWLIARFTRGSALALLCWAPVLMAASDLAENGVLWALTEATARLPRELVWIGNWLSLIKWGATALTFAALLIGVLRWGFVLRRR